MNKYSKLIKTNIKNRYQNCIYNNDLFKSYIAHRKNIIKLLKNKKNKAIFDKNDTTLTKLKNLFLKKKKLSSINQLLNFYKKFEINLCLKKKYGRQFKQRSKINTSFQSYIYLGLMIWSIKKLNIFQKLNIVLKINDILLMNKKNLDYVNYKLLIKLIKLEIKFVNKIKNEF